ncbi:MAG: hypothetical protein AB7S26_04690 [Sandaracinaceae bacterium]
MRSPSLRVLVLTFGLGVSSIVAAAQAPTTEAPAALRVQHVSGTCGENTRLAPETPMHLRATRRRTTFDVRIDDYRFYCSPGPRFTATVESDVLVLRPTAPTGGVSRCTCAHSVRVRIARVPEGVVRVRVEGEGTRPVRRDGRWVEEPIAAEVVADVP